MIADSERSAAIQHRVITDNRAFANAHTSRMVKTRSDMENRVGTDLDSSQTVENTAKPVQRNAAHEAEPEEQEVLPVGTKAAKDFTEGFTPGKLIPHAVAER